MSKIKIGLADDQQLFREGLGAIISGINEFDLLFTANNGAAFLCELGQGTVLPEVALLDIEMPQMDGLELLQKLREQHPDVKVLMLSIHANESLILRLIQMGACGYLLKNCSKEELVHAIKTTAENGYYMNPDTLRAIQHAGSRKGPVRNFAPVDLTHREIEVLKLICQELSNVEIADRLFISPRTVDGHRNNLLLKTGAKNTVGLVLFAVKNHFYEVYG